MYWKKLLLPRSGCQAKSCTAGAKQRFGSPLHVQRRGEALFRGTVARATLRRSNASRHRCTCNAGAKQCFAAPLHVQRWGEAVLRGTATRATLRRSNASRHRCTCNARAKHCFAAPLHVQRWGETPLRDTVASVWRRSPRRRDQPMSRRGSGASMFASSIAVAIRDALSARKVNIGHAEHLSRGPLDRVDLDPRLLGFSRQEATKA